MRLLVIAFFVDCGATYDGASTTTISNLHHLEGKTVAVLGDGAVMPQQVVTDGAITLAGSSEKSAGWLADHGADSNAAVNLCARSRRTSVTCRTSTG